MTDNLVFIPGLLCNHDLWFGQIDAFEQDYDLALFDHMSHDNLPDMVSSFLEEAPEKFTLAGLSMGGYIAFEVMRQAAERVEKLILLDTNARADRQPQIDMRQDLIRRAENEDIRLIAKELTEYLIHPDRMNDRNLCDRIVAMAEDVGAGAFQRQQQALITRPDSRDFLAEITCPAIIISGEQDVLTPPKVHQEMAALIPGAVYHRIADCGHLSTMERPEEVNQLMKSFLES